MFPFTPCDQYAYYYNSELLSGKILNSATCSSSILTVFTKWQPEYCKPI